MSKDNPAKTPTPRSDSVFAGITPDDRDSRIMAALQLARQLETELAAVRADCAAYSEDFAMLGLSPTDARSLLLVERDAKRVAIQRAEQAESALASVRAETIEECAKVCEGRRTHHPHRDNRRQDASLTVAAEAIRALKGRP